LLAAIKLISDGYGAKLTQSILSLFTTVNGRLVRKINCKGPLGQFVEKLANRRKVVFTKASWGFAG
jgi:hypothetical protein